MAVKLTEKAIAAALRRGAEGVRVEVSDEALPGLRLRVTAKGKASWVLACRDHLGRMRRFEIGKYPKDGVSTARDAAREMRVKVRSGADPIADSRRNRALGRDAKDGVGTLGALIALYETKVGAKIKSWPLMRRRIEMVFSAQLQRPVQEITRQDLQISADSYSAGHQAASAVSGLRVLLRWAASRDLADLGLSVLRSPVSKTRRDRVLSRDELAKLLPALSASARPHALALQFMLLTLARREEVGGARWRDVDLADGVWTIPADRSKNKTEHKVPLSKQAVEMLEALGKRASGALVFSNRTGGLLLNWDRETKVIMVASGTEGWTRHDLRRTGATMLGDMGETPDIIEAALNHTSIRSPIAATYNRSRYRPQVALALQRLADAIDAIGTSTAAAAKLNVSNMNDL